MKSKILLVCSALVASSILLSSCSGVMDYGLLLWSVDDPQIASGSVLPVYIKSNIDDVWVVGVPGTKNKLELPLWKLELVGSRSKAKKRAEQFAEYASVYAETLTDGLPIREEPDNSARRVYRLRQGQTVKILSKAKGNPAMAGNAPLPGDWFQVLTDDGSKGYCFSYRLRLFDQADGPVASQVADRTEEADPKLDGMLTAAWRPESYKEMLDSRRIDLERFSTKYGFFPGQDSGVAKLVVPGLDIEQSYSGIKKLRDGVWRFEGSSLQATLRSDTVLAVQFTEGGGAQRTLVFVALPVDADDAIAQEIARREALLAAIRALGPVFRSENYGELAFDETGGFVWTGYRMLSPTTIPADAGAGGTVEMRLFLDDAVASLYSGALSFRFVGAPDRAVDFLYLLEPNGIKLEYLPQASLDGTFVKRRSSSPIVISFVRSEH